MQFNATSVNAAVQKVQYVHASYWNWAVIWLHWNNPENIIIA